LDEDNPGSFLKLLHSIIVDACPKFYAGLVSKGYELFAKKDLAFVQTVFKILIREYGCKPSLTLEQFLSGGYFEAKVEFLILSCEIVRKELKPVKKPRQPIVKNKDSGKSFPTRENDEEDQDEEDDPDEEKPEPFPLGKESTNRPIPVQTKENQFSPSNASRTYEQPTLLHYSKQAAQERSQPAQQSYRQPQMDEDRDKDRIIQSQRAVIEQMKQLLLATTENVQLLTTRLSKVETEMGSKVEALEARIKILEAVNTIRNSSHEPFD